MTCMVLKIQENFKNITFYHILDIILDIQNEKQPLVSYVRLVCILCNKYQYCKRILRVSFSTILDLLIINPISYRKHG